MGQEGQRPVGQRVLDSRRHLGIDLPPDEAILLERPQGGCQHLLRDVGNAPPQLVETHDGRLLQGVKDQQRPFVADAGKDIPDRAIRSELAYQFISIHGKQHNRFLHYKSNQPYFISQQKKFQDFFPSYSPLRQQWFHSGNFVIFRYLLVRQQNPGEIRDCRQTKELIDKHKN